MYIGIHINNAFIATATTDQNNKAILIKDESMKNGKQFMNPLKIYIENEFAYLGDVINYLLTNNYNLDYASNFLDTLSDTKKPVYKDGSGVDWNAATLIAILLKKIKTDIQIYDDSPVRGAVVTVTGKSDPTLIEALKLTFKIAGIPLEAVLEMEKAAVEGYYIANTSATVKYVVLYYLDRYELTVSLNTLDEDNFMKNTCRVTQKKLGEQQLYERLFTFLLKRYEQITGKKIKESKQNFLHIKKLVYELINQMVNDTKLYIQLLFAIDDEIIELIITRAQVNGIIKQYIHETILFLKNEALKDHLEAESVDMVLCVGNSVLFPIIEQQLKIVFHREEQRIYNRYPEEVLTKGAALYANTENKAADTSLITEIIYENDSENQEYKENDADNHKKEQHTNQLIKRVNAIHINDLGEHI